MDLEIILTILSIILSSGVAAYVALRKLPKEQKRAEADIQSVFLEVNAKVQQSYGEIIDELREHIDELSERLDKQRAEFTLEFSSQQTIIEDLKIRLRDTEKRLQDAETSNRKLAVRIDALEKENADLIAENKRLRGGAAA